MSAIAQLEAIEPFPCFGGRCEVIVQGTGPAGTAWEAAARVRRRLEAWHCQFSRFESSSELSRLNSDPREEVPVSPMMARFLQAALGAAAATGGLVDPTLAPELERAGYAGHLTSEPLPLVEALLFAPPRTPAAPSPSARWRRVRLDRHAGVLSRPCGIRIDSGGIAKGLFGDVLAAILELHPSYAICAAGDVRFGGAARIRRQVHVQSPFDETVLHTFELRAGAAATSGIGKRSWLTPEGTPAHHLLDPSTGLPAYTGIVQVTALASTGVEAEALSKAALLSGPGAAGAWLVHGGLVVYDDGTFEVRDPAS